MKTGFIMISTLLSTASASALAIIVSMPAQAGEIDVAGTTGSLTFAAAPGNTLEVSSDGFGGIANYMSGSPSSDSSGSATFFQINPPTGSFLTTDVEPHDSRACAVLSMGHIPINPAGAPRSRRLRLSPGI
jgi:hypothetical protein